jgi:hypothetical protein
MILEMGHVRPASGRQVVDHQDPMSRLQEGFAEVTADETGSAGD